MRGKVGHWNSCASHEKRLRQGISVGLLRNRVIQPVEPAQQAEILKKTSALLYQVTKVVINKKHETKFHSECINARLLTSLWIYFYGLIKLITIKPPYKVCFGVMETVIFLWSLHYRMKIRCRDQMYLFPSAADTNLGVNIS